MRIEALEDRALPSTISGFVDRVSCILKRQAQHLSEAVFIFDEEDLGYRHRASLI